MADMTAGPGTGANASGPNGIQAGKYVNIAAAAVSIALVAGVGVWGYKLLVRDVTGVPVVRAITGDMRVAPENPGGEISADVGLSVNSVAALGGAAQPEDRLVLAPVPPTLQAEDMAVTPTASGTVRAEAGEVVPQGPDQGIAAVLEEEIATTLQLDADDSADVRPAASLVVADPSVPLTAADVLALADQIAAGASPLSDLAAGQTVPAAVAVNGVIVPEGAISISIPGVTRSLRPSPRPAEARAAGTRAGTEAVVASGVQAASVTGEITGIVSTASLAVGTKLVQLGAFDSADIAATEWARLTERFPDFFAGKDQLIQQAESGGRVFFRLRAIGFDDLSDARRFCAMLSAEGAACIPVVVR